MPQWARQRCRREKATVLLQDIRHRAAMALLPAWAGLLAGLRPRLFLIVFPRVVRLIFIWPDRLARAFATRDRATRFLTYPAPFLVLVLTKLCARNLRTISSLRVLPWRRTKGRATSVRGGLLPTGERLAPSNGPRKCSRVSLVPTIGIDRRRLGLRCTRPRWAKTTRERSRISAAPRLRANAHRYPPPCDRSGVASLHRHGFGISISHD